MTDYYDTSYPPSLWQNETPPVVPATGAIAGTPGTWTPVGSTPPATVANLIAGVPNAVVANPATAWTTGQRVNTGDGANAYWSGAAWLAGIATTTEEEGTMSPTEPDVPPTEPDVPPDEPTEP